MTPTLHEHDSATFSSIGLGGLREALRCQVEWQANGPYELEMDYPVSGRRYAELKPRRIIYAGVGPDEDPQPFRIYRVTKPLLNVSTVYARHIAYDLMGYTLSPFAAESLADAVHQLQSGAVTAAHRFTIAAEKTSSTPITVSTPRSVWSMLGGQRGSLLDVYGGEWAFNGFTVTLCEQLGTDLGVTVRYGVNLQTLEQDENIASTWTAVHPYWHDETTGQTVTLAEGAISTGTFDYVRILVLDLSAEWAEAPTEDQLRARTKQYISDNKVGVPDVGLDVTFVPLDQTEEYKDRAFLNKIHKGDAVTVEFPTAYDPDTGEPTDFVLASARAVEYVWLPLDDRYERIRLGSVKANFAAAMAQVQKDVQWLIRQVK